METNEKDFIAWLITQPNANGTPYLERVAQQYVRYLRSHPSKLELPLEQSKSIMFRCSSVREFDELCETFRSAPNFRDINSQGHYSFSAGLSAYRRYLQFIEERQQHNMIGRDIELTDVLDILIELFNRKYANGFRFETTSINLLSSDSSILIDEHIQSELKRLMFCRNDGVCFMLDVVTDANIRKKIVEQASSYLQEYGCFEISELYKLFEDQVNQNCIKSAEDFELFYKQICENNVRCVAAPQFGNRIARNKKGSIWISFKNLTSKIMAFICDEYYGSCNEDDLHIKFCAFSTDLLYKIIRQYASEELICVRINESLCYQTYEALGLPENFSETLQGILERLDNIGLEPSSNVLHTAVSLELGVNFMAEFNLPDWDTFRRLVAMFYKAEPHRVWKSGVFREVAE